MDQNDRLSVVEFFSGIGGWHCAIEKLECLRSRLRVVRSFDVNAEANAVYKKRFGATCVTRDITLLKVKDVVADVWVMSPPCQPFTAGGKMLDDQDTRCAAILHLIALIPQANPKFLALENVPYFGQSAVRKRLISVLDEANYVYAEYIASPHEMGVPNRRLRYFLVARKRDTIADGKEFAKTLFEEAAENVPLPPLATFFANHCGQIDSQCNMTPVPSDWFNNSFRFHCVPLTAPNCCTATVTRAYFDHKNGGGSYVICGGENQNANTELLECQTDVLHGMQLRFMSVAEILALMGFPKDFEFPEATSLRNRYRLLGNSVSVDVISKVLEKMLML